MSYVHFDNDPKVFFLMEITLPDGYKFAFFSVYDNHDHSTQGDSFTLALCGVLDLNKVYGLPRYRRFLVLLVAKAN